MVPWAAPHPVLPGPLASHQHSDGGSFQGAEQSSQEGEVWGFQEGTQLCSACPIVAMGWGSETVPKPGWELLVGFLSWLCDPAALLGAEGAALTQLRSVSASPGEAAFITGLGNHMLEGFSVMSLVLEFRGGSPAWKGLQDWK